MSNIHKVQIVFSTLAVGLPVTAMEFPTVAKPYFLATAAVCALIAGVLGALSGSMLPEKTK